MRKSIIVIGGMGPQASLRFHQLLIEKSAQYHKGENHEFPYVVHFSLPVEDFISNEAKQRETAALLNQLSETIEQLQPAVITLACNTAHILQPNVAFMQQPIFMSMLEVVAAKAACNGVRSIGLLASPTTIRTKLYEETLTRHGIRTLHPQSKQLPILEAGIRNVISETHDEHIQSELSGVATTLVSSGAEAILLGCTELPLIFNMTSVRVPVFDCLDIYADAVIEQYYLYNGA